MSSQQPSQSTPCLTSSYTNLLYVPQKRYSPKTISEDADTLAPFEPISFLFKDPLTGKVSQGFPLAYVAAQGENANLAHLLPSAGDKVFKDAYRAYLRILVSNICIASNVGCYVLNTGNLIVAWIRARRIRDVDPTHYYDWSHHPWSSCSVYSENCAAVLRGMIDHTVIFNFILTAASSQGLKSTQCLPSQQAWAVAPDGRWRVEDLVLMALHLVHGNTFQAEFKVNTD